MDDGLTEIPKGNQIVRTPVSGGGVRMSVADPVAAAAAASKNPANVGISEQSGPASLVGQGGAGTGGGGGEGSGGPGTGGGGEEGAVEGPHRKGSRWLPSPTQSLLPH